MSIDKGPVIVVGAGPAGLAVSHELQGAGVDHIVLERGDVGQSWRDRWDSFCLVTPNWYLQLPGGAYAGEDPDGFMSRDEVVAHLQRYARGFEAPILNRIDVTALCSDPSGGFVLRTSEGQMRTDAVVLATGAFQRPHRPPVDLPAGLLAIDADSYTNPDGLPAGGVLVVGSGQTGCQLAEELHRAGRDVTLACGRAAWAPRRVEGRDIVSWLVETPFLEQAVEDLPSPLARLAANFQTSGRDRGRDLNYRTLLADGVTLTGHLLGADETRLRFVPDLAESVAWGDARYADICNLLAQAAINRGAPPPDLAPPEALRADPPDEIRVRDLGAVVFTSGYRPAYRDWVQFPAAFDELGFPFQRDGASTVVPGLYFVGTHFLRKRKSSTLFGMGEDAEIVARAIAARLT
ncbi:MAG TPA: NAD(P)-binding domain-containing protein [Acidimicrobiales bacterium]